MKAGDKNIWIEGVMNSLDSVQRAEPSDAIYRNIEKGISLPFTKGRIIPLRKVSLAAACVLLLLVLNVVLLSMRSKPVDKSADSMERVMDYYGLTNDNGGFDI